MEHSSDITCHNRVTCLTAGNAVVTGLAAVLQPAKVHVAKGVSRDAVRAEVVILVNVRVENRIHVLEDLVRGQGLPHGRQDVRVLQPLHELGRADGVVDDALDVVEDEDLPEVPHLQHALRAVVADAVALQHVLYRAHLPGQPPLPEGRVDTEHVRQVT